MNMDVITMQDCREYAQNVKMFLPTNRCQNFHHTSIPDRLVIFPGRYIGFAELKQKGKKPTKLQNLQIQRL